MSEAASPSPPQSESSAPSPPQREVDYYQVANELINGKSVSDVDPADISGTLLSLCILRRDAVLAGALKTANRIGKLLRALNSSAVPPVVPTARPPSPRRSTNAKPSSAKAPRDSPPRESISTDDIEHFSSVIEILLNDDQPIVFEHSMSRQKLLRVLARRSEQALNDGDYSTLQAFDQLYHRVQRSGAASDSCEVRAVDPVTRWAALVERRKLLEEKKAKELREARAGFAQKRLQLDEHYQTGPALSQEKKYRHSSRVLLDLRRAAAAHARAGEYNTAIALRKQAAEAEASEKQAHENRRSRDNERITRHEAARREKADHAFQSWCRKQEITTCQKFDPQIDALTRMIQALDRELAVIGQPAWK
jgi:hypothetical protein